MDEFWARMTALFGHTWAGQYGESPTGIGGDTWAAALAGLSAAQIGVGLKAVLLLGDEWPPSAPHFRALCFGIPSFAAVRYEFAHGEDPRTPFGLLCWRYIDPFALRQADQRAADRLVHDAYELAKAFVVAGGEVPPVPLELAKPEPAARIPASPETVQRCVDEALTSLGGAA